MPVRPTPKPGTLRYWRSRYALLVSLSAALIATFSGIVIAVALADTTKRPTFPIFVLLCLVFVVPVLLWLADDARRQCEAHRALAPVCRHCGYDLRASPWGCPECGTRASAEL